MPDRGPEHCKRLEQQVGPQLPDRVGSGSRRHGEDLGQVGGSAKHSSGKDKKEIHKITFFLEFFPGTNNPIKYALNWIKRQNNQRLGFDNRIKRQNNQILGFGKIKYWNHPRKS